MSYETLKQFSINLKDLTVKYSYSSNNLRDWRDRLVVEKVEKTFESKKELEDYLLGLVSGVIDGVTRLPRSLPMYKRIQWLIDNDLIENDMAKDTEEVRKSPYRRKESTTETIHYGNRFRSYATQATIWCNPLS